MAEHDDQREAGLRGADQALLDEPGADAAALRAGIHGHRGERERPIAGGEPRAAVEDVPDHAAALERDETQLGNVVTGRPQRVHELRLAPVRAERPPQHTAHGVAVLRALRPDLEHARQRTRASPRRRAAPAGSVGAADVDVHVVGAARVGHAVPVGHAEAVGDGRGAVIVGVDEREDLLETAFLEAGAERLAGAPVA
jgi:hypothetical protein